MYSLLAPISAHVQFCWTSSLNPPGSSLADALLEKLLLDCWRSFTQSCLSCFSWLLVQSFFCADGRAVDGMQKKSAPHNNGLHFEVSRQVSLLHHWKNLLLLVLFLCCPALSFLMVPPKEFTDRLRSGPSLNTSY